MHLCVASLGRETPSSAIRLSIMFFTWCILADEICHMYQECLLLICMFRSSPILDKLVLHFTMTCITWMLMMNWNMLQDNIMPSHRRVKRHQKDSWCLSSCYMYLLSNQPDLIISPFSNISTGKLTIDVINAICRLELFNWHGLSYLLNVYFYVTNTLLVI